MPKKIADVVDLVQNHGGSFEREPPRNARDVLRESHRPQHLRPEHACQITRIRPNERDEVRCPSVGIEDLRKICDTLRCDAMTVPASTCQHVACVWGGPELPISTYLFKP